MKVLSRILSICLCSVPIFNFAAHAVVATTSGHNLTAYNPSYTNNNQWASLTNVRENSSQPTAKADFGNCNAVIMRCATPKCSNGGCVDSNVAAAIVAGCVQSNESCSQYGEDLISYMTAQLVANSTAKVNAQRAASDAAVAAAQSAQAEQTAQQIAQIQSSMQQQMAQMQQQMAQQNAMAQQQLQEALAAQQEQNASALQNITAAAASASATTYTPEVPAVLPDVSSPQEQAIERGVSSEILVRQQVTGQIMTEIENAETSLKEAKTAMQNSFEYAGCDARGNNCKGPKRVTKWRELATEFLEPYDNTIDKVYDALVTAQTVGVDLSQIYMMLNGSCNTWGQYMCQAGGEIHYDQQPPQVCRNEEAVQKCINNCATYQVTYDIGPKVSSTLNFSPDFDLGGGLSNSSKTNTNKYDFAHISATEYVDKECPNRCRQVNCKPCTLLKVLNDAADVYEGWVNPTATAEDNGTIIACVSGALDSSKLFARRTRSKNGIGMVDIDQLDIWLHQTEPSIKEDNDKFSKYCYTSGQEAILKTSMTSRNVPAKGKKFCVGNLSTNEGSLTPDTTDCPFIAGTYAICDVHPYNYDIETLSSSSIGDKEKIKEIVAMKVTVVSQQIYKQYEYLNATLRRLKTQLEKAVLTTTLQAAGAKSDGSDSSSSSGGGLLGGGSAKNSQYANCSGKNIQEAIYCLRQNYGILSTQIENKKCNSNIKKQLEKDLVILNGKIPKGNASIYTAVDSVCLKANTITDCSHCLEEYSNGLNTLDDVQLDKEAKRAGRWRDD